MASPEVERGVAALFEVDDAVQAYEADAWAASDRNVVHDIIERVARGVVWLDREDSGWWRTDTGRIRLASQPIDLDALDMRLASRCVLGFRFGDYWNMAIAGTEEAFRRGFALSDQEYGAHPERYEPLTWVWRAVIRARRVTLAEEVAAADTRTDTGEIDPEMRRTLAGS